MNSFRRIVFIFLIGMGLAFIAHKIISKGLSCFNVHRYSRLQEIFVNNTAYDVLFIGSSRTHTTIYPRIIDSVTGLSTYNAGVEGGVLREFRMTMNGYLLHHPAPKLLVLTIDPGSFDLSKPLFDPTQYFPFINRNKYVEEGIEAMDPKSTLIKYLPFFEFIYMDDNVKNNAIRGLAGQSEMQAGQFDNKGFLSNGMACIDTNKNINVRYNDIDPLAVKILDEIIDTCKSKNIQLMLTYAPEYRFKYQEKFPNFNTFTRLIENIKQEKKLDFYRDDSLAMNNNACYFANYGHTNTEGAIEYSRLLGQRIKEWQAFNRFKIYKIE